jgi:hypothetical protein
MMHKYTVILSFLERERDRTVIENAQKRSGTVNGLKRSYCARLRSETFTKTRSHSRSKNERITY